MWISVIPLDFSIDHLPLTYWADDVWWSQICKGGIVSIPYGKNEGYGVICEITENPLIPMNKVKSIGRVVANAPIVPEYQIAVSQELAREYFLPIHQSLSLFLPAWLVDRYEKNEWIIPISISRERTTENPESSLIFPFEIWAFFDTLSTYLALPNTLIIFPDQGSIQEYIHRTGYTGAVWSDDATPQKKYRLREKIAKNTTTSLIAGRKMLFQDIQKFEKIIYVDDGLNDEYSLFLSKISYRTVCSIIQKHLLGNYFFVSCTPSILSSHAHIRRNRFLSV